MCGGFAFPVLLVCCAGVIVGLPLSTSANLPLHATNAFITPDFDEVIKAREEKTYRLFISCTRRCSVEGQSSGMRVVRRYLQAFRAEVTM